MHTFLERAMGGSGANPSCHTQSLGQCLQATTVRVCGLVVEAGVPQENLHKHQKVRQTLNKTT